MKLGKEFHVMHPDKIGFCHLSEQTPTKGLLEFNIQGLHGCEK